MTNLVPFQEMEHMADAIVKSKFYGFKSKDEILAVMLVAQAENKHPATVVQEYDIIQGRPALKSQAMLARFQQAGGTVQWHEMTATKVSATFSHPSGGSLRLEWTIDMAERAGLVRQGSGWTKYPADMLAARVISSAVRKVYPACILGRYAPEEVADFEPQEKFMGQVETVQPSPAAHLPLMVPGSTEPYATLGSDAEWADAFVNLAQRIYKSEKLLIAQKDVKFDDLKGVNSEYLNRIFPEARKAIMDAVDEFRVSAIEGKKEAPVKPSKGVKDDSWSSAYEIVEGELNHG